MNIKWLNTRFSKKSVVLVRKALENTCTMVMNIYVTFDIKYT